MTSTESRDLTTTATSSGADRSVSVKILRHNDQYMDGEIGTSNIFTDHLIHWKIPPITSTEKATYVCIDPSRQYCAVYLLQAFVIELWDISSLPCVMSSLTLPALPSPWDKSCQCMAWSADGRFLCSVFGGRFPSTTTCSFIMVWDVESSCLLTTQQYVIDCLSHMCRTVPHLMLH